METNQWLDSSRFVQMLERGCANLARHKQEINDLNVFPIPDGDTGENMYLTLSGGVRDLDPKDSLTDIAKQVADGMLLSARGNSGVILSQIAAGIAEGLSGTKASESETLLRALQCGVDAAYSAVVEPTEGTMLTVYRCATEAVTNRTWDNPEALLRTMLEAARETLSHTPEMLPVLAKAGVVDSGGAGLVCILQGLLEGMLDEVPGAENSTDVEPISPVTQTEIDFDRFNADSELTYGYCTELLIRLQNCKTDIATFDTATLTEPLQQIGDSLVIWQKDSLVKLHVHTKTPDKVLALCQRYGEFLQVKIENMSLQHNSTLHEESKPQKDHTAYAVVAVTTGEGIGKLLTERGADVLVGDNPSTEDFLEAFAAANADTIFVLPNNSNILLSARQAASLYHDADVRHADVRVIESHNIGEGLAALSMLSYDSGDTDAIVQDLTDAMDGVVTAAVSRCMRNTEEVHKGEYLGFVGKEILASGTSRLRTACALTDALSNGVGGEVWLLLRGKGVPTEEMEQVEAYIHSHCPGKEVYPMDGGQAIYDYIFILE